MCYIQSTEEMHLNSLQNGNSGNDNAMLNKSTCYREEKTVYSSQLAEKEREGSIFILHF